MVDIVCACIAAIATVLCAVVAASAKQRDKALAEASARQDKKADERAKESRLQLAMISANTKLTIGLAMAMKHGHCNGEVEEGLKAVNDANEKYTQYLEGIAIDHLAKGR